MTDTVLIVHASLTVRMDLQEAFEEGGFRTLVCATAAAARGTLAGAAAHVIVLDVLLPDGDGVDLLRELRASPGSDAAAVLMLSTEAEVKDRVRGLRIGVDEYVRKPYDSHYVVARARELLRARRADTGAARSTILIVDHRVTFREALRQALEEAGHTVLVAGSGEEGLHAAAAERPGAIVVDCDLPGFDGAAMIRRLRLDTALRDVPCLLLTGADDRDAELCAVDAGADAFVRKEEDVELILARLAAVLRSAATSIPDKVASLLGPKRILVVDDSATYLAEVAAMLRDEDYDVVPARSGEEALELLAVRTMDCILLDLIMPGLSGRETCQRIKAAPIVRDIPLIMLTALEDRAAMLDALAAGADDYIQKSSEFEVLQARVRAQLRRKQFEDENRRFRAELHNMELEAAEARAARALAESRAELLAILDKKNQALEAANAQLQTRQLEVVQTNRELARANQAKTDFLSIMSHELRTPLNGILGYAQILRRDKRLDERQIAGLNVIQQSGEHLLTLINDILDLAKIEAGKLELSRADIALAKFLRMIAGIIKVRARQKDLDFICDIAPDLPGGIHTDESRLRQVLLNLLANAVKFTDRGQVRLRVRFSPPARLRFEVQDTGIGIDADHLDTIFQPFEQVSNPQRRLGGTGLGLAISRQFVQLMGGDIHVTSQVGVGTTFWFELDVPVIETVVAAPPERLVTGYEGPRKTVLVADDVAANRAMAVDLLSQLGFDVIEAANGREALEKAQAMRPDWILMDIVMPEMDGLEAARRLRQLPGLEDVPIIAMSASASGSDEQESLAAGVNAFVRKPIDLDQLLTQIATLLMLHWIDEPKAPPAAEGEAGGPLVAPPAQELEHLYQLARLGNMRDIVQWTERVAALDERYRPFTDQLRLMAKGFQSKAILTLVERYLESRPGA
jgi:DNA-binding response OmpR family regulator